MQRLVPAETYANVLDAYASVQRSCPADRPWVPASMVAGLDGCAALFQQIRSLAHIVLVGAETVRRERYGQVVSHPTQRRLAESTARARVTVTGGDSVDLGQALGMLRSEGHQIVLCEDGPHLLGELVAGDLLDELCLTLSPTMGGDPLPISVTPAGSPLRPFDLAHVAESDGHLFLHYERTTHGS